MKWSQYVLLLVVAAALEIVHPNLGLVLIATAGLDAYMQVNKRGRK